MDLGLSDKRVVVTGASQGIGLAIAKGFLAEGARVVIVARGEQKLKGIAAELTEQCGAGRVLPVACDCADASALAQLKDKVVAEFGGVDVVVANVGDGRSVPDAIPDDEHWQKVWQTNFDTSLYTARTFLALLEESQGSLLFISSITGLEAFGAPVDYSTAKFAVVAFAKNVARKVAKSVRVNVITPGNVNFPGSSWEAKIQADPGRIENIINSTVPMQRFGTPEEIADAAVFLSSNRASFITGSVLVADGGQTVGVF